MITAKQARELVQSFETKIGKKAKEKLDLAVRNAVGNGDEEVWIHENQRLLKVIELIAKDAGYKVTYSASQRDGDSVKLEW